MKYKILNLLLQVSECLLSVLVSLGLVLMVFLPSTIVPLLLLTIVLLAGHFWLSAEVDKVWNKEHSYFKQG